MKKAFTLEKKGSNMFTLLLILCTSLSWISFIDCIVLGIGIEKYNIINYFIIPNIILIALNTIYLFIFMGKRICVYYSISERKSKIKFIFDIMKRQLIYITLVNLLIGCFKSLNVQIEFLSTNLVNIYNPFRFYLFIASWFLPLVSYRGINRELCRREANYYNEIENKKREVLLREIKNNRDNYLNKIENLINQYEFPNQIYEKNDLYKVIQSKKTKYLESLNLNLNNKMVIFNKNKDFIEKYTNTEKIAVLDKQIKDLKEKYGVDEINNIVKIISDDIPKFRNIDYYPNSFKALLSNNYDISFIKQLKVFKTDIETFLNIRIKYLQNERSSAMLGYDGEKEVNEELDKYSNEFINIRNKIFDLDKIDFINDEYVMECDNILITRYGIFILEVKNRGVYSIYKNAKGRNYNKYKIIIEPEGRWVKSYRDGGKEVLDSNPVLQNRNHIIKVRDIINHNLGYTQDDKEYVDVKGIIVITNEDVDFKNKSRESIIRTKYIYNEITKNERIFDRKQMLKFKEILDSYDSIDHLATKYEVINVYDEISSLEENINKFIKINKLDEIFNKLEEIEQNYIEDEENIRKEIDRLYTKQKNKISKLKLTSRVI